MAVTKMNNPMMTTNHPAQTIQPLPGSAQLAPRPQATNTTVKPPMNSAVTRSMVRVEAPPVFSSSVLIARHERQVPGQQREHARREETRAPKKEGAEHGDEIEFFNGHGSFRRGNGGRPASVPL